MQTRSVDVGPTSNGVKCPVCRSQEVRLLWSATSSEAAQHFVLYERDSVRHAALAQHIQELWHRDSCEVVQCAKCQFSFSVPFVAGDEVFYNLAYSRESYPDWKWEYEVTYRLLSNMRLPSDAKILEIGAGEGAFLKRMADSVIPRKNIVCTEYSREGIRRLRRQGFHCLTGDIRDLVNEWIPDRVDIICMFQVLEHMDNLDKLFNVLRTVLKPRGSVFIAVPNHEVIDFNERNGAHLDMPPNHIGRWNRNAFEIMASRHGFCVEDYRVENGRTAPKLTQFAIGLYRKRAQMPSSLENRIQRIKNRGLLRACQLLGVGANAVKSIPILAKAAKLGGNSQWVQLVRYED